tara:strand:+ start:121 stop:282 length:162 start_codon:yes stop_codon:yes gene_type:complete
LDSIKAGKQLGYIEAVGFSVLQTKTKRFRDYIIMQSVTLAILVALWSTSKGAF